MCHNRIIMRVIWGVVFCAATSTMSCSNDTGIPILDLAGSAGKGYGGSSGTAGQSSNGVGGSSSGTGGLSGGGVENKGGAGSCLVGADCPTPCITCKKGQVCGNPVCWNGQCQSDTNLSCECDQKATGDACDYCYSTHALCIVPAHCAATGECTPGAAPMGGQGGATAEGGSSGESNSGQGGAL
jgi:hypothetical protein